MPTEFTADKPLSELLDLAFEVLGVHCDPGENFFDHGDSMAAARLCTLAARPARLDDHTPRPLRLDVLRPPGRGDRARRGRTRDRRRRAGCRLSTCEGARPAIRSAPRLVRRTC
ncbi:hypothetical protein [Actinomadura madurae]|uniref:hypothetical protein n=1 Tax=Actinomadura madurae TaxID=1993 RepID=UPI0020D1FFAD|nr:hypothetical protein [Actinomadura madurae]MCQ0016716.1 hypothetical protein [Actinomadura madurae]